MEEIEPPENEAQMNADMLRGGHQAMNGVFKEIFIEAAAIGANDAACEPLIRLVSRLTGKVLTPETFDGLMARSIAAPAMEN